MDSRAPYSQADALIDFWNQAGPAAWFAKNPDFDAAFCQGFSDAHFAAARRELDHWLDDAMASLALVLLLDQFPRNAFRGTAHMYATDGLARHCARQAITAGRLEQVGEPLALFLCVPFIHSESLADQRYGLELYQRHSPANSHFAQDHHDIIARFGRFPHRNPELGRISTPEELRFLHEGGFAG
ncbi:DUF924 family protein [Pollutimonas sp. H1-120]|uniref:DUF924 family protein n=1 Tax=Pollutimonas sp. H1-120 TaxID=3148824 RepID=UPI003B52C3F9